MKNVIPILGKTAGVLAKPAVALLFAVLLLSPGAQGQTYPTSVPPEGGYVKREGNSKVIVFVHGIYSGSDAWKCDDEHYWPAMIAKDADPILRASDIYVVGYPTSKLHGRMTMPDLITEIANQLVTDKVFSSHKQVVFVAHSMGGLVVEQLLLTYQDKAPADKVSAIFLYGTPLEGSKVADIGRFFISDPLLKELTTGDRNLLLHEIDQRWLHAEVVKIPRYCAYEKLPEDGFIVVDQDSATRGCKDEIAIDSNHANLVKPCSTRTNAYIWVLNGLREVEQPNEQAAPLPPAHPSMKPTRPSPYSEVQRLLDQIRTIQNSYEFQARQISRSFHLPYQMQPGAADRKELPDYLLKSLADADVQASDDYARLNPQLSSVRDQIVACFQLTPNEIQRDNEKFLAANGAALRTTHVDQLEIDQPNTGRFSAIIGYLTNYSAKLGNSRCGMY